MAKKVGTCVNIDCDNYKQDVEVEPGGEFECPICHQPLREKATGPAPDPDPRMRILLIVAAVLVLGGGGYGLYSYLNGDKEPETVVEQPKPVAPETPKDTATVAPEEPKVATPEPKRVDPKPTTPQNGRGTVDLGYGTYTGDLKNGKPHGYGTITYKKEQKIVPSKDFVAQPGDTFEGEFRDGRISGLGYWNHNGNKTAVKP
ncbi:hypothetical protein M3090_14380 [Bacteroides sp. ET71]|uniref:hypothetical protein n=1 Tax=Bacteroides sp. ET71 TaxID=2939421 RepID=UPI002012022D|nr:hypothetical protein [Bacteroides sp. ET71]MCL1617575.1 hypothetical protein [Bacteroides sp. ET71]